jgi:serine/threonine protein kinase/tetratricopeptide (TPR) repeat protein
MVGKRLAHYEIREKLGEGGMGEVYVAEDTRLDRRVALKVLPEKMAEDPERLERFEREAKAVAALNHPNIVTIHSVEEADGHHFITMELVVGKTLAESLLKGPLSLESFFEVAARLADALSAAHSQGITHRDLKPANVMVGDDGRVKVLDFGLAKLRGLGPTSETTELATATMTQQGMILGTVPYMSPEQLQGKPVDHRSDIFSLGILLYETATGRRPFQGETSVDLISAILRDSPRPVTEIKMDLPSDLGRIVRRCLEKDPQRRYQSVQDIRTELEDIQSEAVTKTTEQPSIAVLPFVDMSPERDQEYFCDGTAEELINSLIKAGGLRVASRTSAFGYKGKDLKIQEMGKELNVGTVLEGSVRKAGNRLRINAQLVNVTDGYQLWAETFDREMEDVFAIQDEIARNISRALKGVLTDQEEGHSLPKVPTASVKAYEFYLRGRQLFHGHSRNSLERARRLFQRACELDPDYGNAWAGVADCCSLMYMYWDASESQLEQAEEASRKALELDPDAAETHVARGLAVSLNKRYDEATREFELAIRQNSELYEAFYFFARACVAQGKMERAAELFEQACRMRPEDYVAPAFLGGINSALGRKNESEAAYRRSLDAAEGHLELFPEEPRALYMGAISLAALDENERARDWADRALIADPEEPIVLYNVACTYACLGEVEKAIDCLDEAITFGMGQKEWFEHDTDLDPLREHPRFKALLERL